MSKFKNSLMSEQSKINLNKVDMNNLVDSFYAVTDNMTKLTSLLKKAGMDSEAKHIEQSMKHIDMTKLGKIL